jgi:hypothetical protein
MPAETRASIRRKARLAGGLYLSLVPLGFFSFVCVPSVLFVRGDAAATSGNIMASEWLFRSGIVSHLISQIIVILAELLLPSWLLIKGVTVERWQHVTC